VMRTLRSVIFTATAPEQRRPGCGRSARGDQGVAGPVAADALDVGRLVAAFGQLLRRTRRPGDRRPARAVTVALTPALRDWTDRPHIKSGAGSALDHRGQGGVGKSL
jgi:hypothetical protein